MRVSILMVSKMTSVLNILTPLKGALRREGGEISPLYNNNYDISIMIFH